MYIKLIDSVSKNDVLVNIDSIKKIEIIGKETVILFIDGSISRFANTFNDICNLIKDCESTKYTQKKTK